MFSNSVIEHVGSREKQTLFAREIARVGRRYWVQTPAYEFFIEPHYIAPFIHWLSDDYKRRLARYFTPWGLITKPTARQIQERIEEIRLLTEGDMKALFPASKIHYEGFLGMCKSYSAYRV